MAHELDTLLNLPGLGAWGWVFLDGMSVVTQCTSVFTYWNFLCEVNDPNFLVQDIF